MHAEAKYPDEASFYAAAIATYVSGDDDAGDRIGGALAGSLRREARVFLGDDSPDVDDVVQDTTLAVLHYLRVNGGFKGNLVKFAVTVARNRCRNLLNWRTRLPHLQIDPMLEWLQDPGRSPLEMLLDEEVTRLLQETLDLLSEDCRILLRALFLEDVSVEEVRDRVGLASVQGVYYRKTVCLDQAYRRLKSRLSICSAEWHRVQERGKV